MKQLPETVIHIVFNVSEEEGHLNSSLNKKKAKSRVREIAYLSQQQPRFGEWTDFLINSMNKCRRLMLLLTDFF